MKYKSTGGEGMNVPVLIQKTFIYFHTNIEKHIRVEENGSETIYYTYDVEKLPLREGAEKLASLLEGKNV